MESPFVTRARALQSPGRQESRTLLWGLFKNKHKTFNATIASCMMNASGVSPWKRHTQSCKSKRRQPEHPTTLLGWHLFSHTHPSPQAMGPVGGLCLQTGCQAAGELLHGSRSPDGKDQALFAESSLTHLSIHSWQTLTASVVLGSMSVSKAPVIPILNGTLSSLQPEETAPSANLLYKASETGLTPTGPSWARTSSPRRYSLRQSSTQPAQLCTSEAPSAFHMLLLSLFVLQLSQGF